jgi:zinc D-Ala-D-Ala carboxypeptidase
MKIRFIIFQQKSIVRLAFVVCCPIMWAATCQPSPSQPEVSHSVERRNTMNEALPNQRDTLTNPKDSALFRQYTKEELLGQFEPAKHPDFTLIQSIHTNKDGIYMQAAAYDAFKQMLAAAKKEGLTLTIISATRNFKYQKGIWEKKWLREKYKGWSNRDKVADILKYSSMPGTSRHHWGTDVDFNSVELSYWQSGAGAKLYNWLQKNANEFGFYQTYTAKDNGRKGYEEEKWHWSYMPIASEMHQQYRSRIDYADIRGFSGCEEAEPLMVFETYVDGIASGALK